MKKTINQLLKEARKEKGLYQWELAEKIGVSQSALGKMEKEQHNLTFKTAQKIADALDKDIEVKLVDKENSCH